MNARGRARRSPRAEARFVQYLTYAAGGVAACWGVIEILLVIDPFRATWFKYSGWLGLLAALIGAPLAANLLPRPRLWLALLGLIGLAACAIVAAQHYGAVSLDRQLEAPLSQLDLFLVLERGRNAGYPWLQPLYAAGAIGAALVLFTFIVAGAGRAAASAITAPMVVAILVVALFLSLLSAGRARTIDQRDIALEELRKAGMPYDIAALQQPLYFLNDRGLKLYREAGFQRDDVLGALARPLGDAAGERPLFYEMLTRAARYTEPGLAARGAGLANDGAADARTRRISALLREALTERPEAPDPQDYDRPLQIGASSEPGAAAAEPARPLLSHLIENGALRLATAVLEDGAAAPLGAAAWTERPAHMGPEAPEEALRETGPLSANQAHLYTLFDPLLAVAHARLRQERPLSVDRDAAQICALAAALAEQGLQRPGFLEFGLTPLACKDALKIPPVDLAAAPEPVRAYLSETRRAGYGVRRRPAGGCVIDDFTFDFAPGRISMLQERDGERARPFFVAPFRGAHGAARLRGVAQIALRPDADGAERWSHRLIYGAPTGGAELTATAWRPLQDGALEPIAAAPGQMLAANADLGALFRRTRLPKIALKLTDRPDGAAKSARQAPISAERGARYAVTVDLAATIEVSIERRGPATDLCVEARRADNGAPLASLFAPAGDDGLAVLETPPIAPGTPLELRVAAAAPEADTRYEIAFRAAASPLSFTGSEDMAPPRPLEPGLAGSGATPPSQEDLFTAVSIAETSLIALDFEAERPDAALTLHRDVGGARGAEMARAGPPTGASGARRLTAVLEPGVYWLRGQGGAAQARFSMAVDAVTGLKPDPRGANTPGAPHPLPPVRVDGQSSAIAGLLGAASEYYTFTLPRRAATRIRLTDLKSDVEMALLDKQGREIGFSRRPLANDEVIAATLSAGAYRVALVPYDDGGARFEETPFRLTVEAQTP